MCLCGALRRRGRGGYSGSSTAGTTSPLTTSSRGSSRTGHSSLLCLSRHHFDFLFYDLYSNFIRVQLKAAVWSQEPEEGGQGDGGDRGHEEEGAAGGPEQSRSSGVSLVRAQPRFCVPLPGPGTRSFKMPASSRPHGCSGLYWPREAAGGSLLFCRVPNNALNSWWCSDTHCRVGLSSSTNSSCLMGLE